MRLWVPKPSCAEDCAEDALIDGFTKERREALPETEKRERKPKK